MADAFFTVFNPEGEAPAKRPYPSHGAAMRDACALAEKRPDQTFFVMRSCSRPITAETVAAHAAAKAEAEGQEA